MNNINTVNVLVNRADNLEENVDLISFKDDEEGNVEAENYFSQVCKRFHPEIDDEDVEIAIEDGIYEWNGYRILLIHSNNDMA